MHREPQLGSPCVELDTPALLIDLDCLERNIARMSRFFADRPTALRPHAKTHKCPQIAHRQLDAGAIGITCAKVSEAEVLVKAGIRDILIANQIIGKIKIDRLTDLCAEADLIVAVDDSENVQALSKACQEKSTMLRILIELDIGMKRSGVQPDKQVCDLAREIEDAPNLHFSGLLAYEGHLVMVPDSQERAARVRKAMAPVAQVCSLLEKAGLPVEVVSGGGTGTYDMTGTIFPMTEIEAGSYVFMDTKYLTIRPEFESALTVLSTVISRPTPDRIVTDAGMKSMTREFGLPQPVGHKGIATSGLSEEHGKLVVTDPEGVELQPGDKIQFIPSHGCTTVNLHDWYYACRNGVIEDIWAVAARGCAQ